MDPAKAFDDLLQHRQMVHSLVHALLAGHETAEDVEQATWVEALQKPRPAYWPPTLWLGGIARNLTRRSRRDAWRQQQRESAAARPEATRSTVEVVAEEETRRRLVEAVLSLGEPYRSVVLLRYYDGLPPRRMAAQLGLPAATVRSHLSRGLAQLRERLADEHGGQKAWIAALAPLRALPVKLTTTGVLLLMTPAKKMAIVGLLLVSLTTGFVLMNSRGSEPVAVAGSTPPGGEVAAAAIKAADVPGPVRQEAPAVPVPGRGVVRLVAAEDRSPLPGAQVQVVHPDGAIETATADQRGECTAGWREPVTLWAHAAGRAPRRETTEPLAEGELVLALTRGPRIQLRFTAADGATLPAAGVQHRYQQAQQVARAELVMEEVLSGGGVEAMVQAMFAPAPSWRFPCTFTWNANGAELQAVLPAGRWRVVVARPQVEPWLSSVVEGTAAIELAVPLGEARMQRVQLLAAENGQPLGGAEVRAHTEFGDDQAFFAGDVRTADAEGMLELPLPDNPRSWPRPPSWWATTATHAAIVRVNAGADLQQVRVPLRGRITGRAFGDDGKLAVGRAVFVSPGKGIVLRASVAEDGIFTIDGVPATEQALVVLAGVSAATMTRTTSVAVQPGATVEVTLGDPVAGATIRGRVRSAGEGVAAFFGARAVRGRDQRGCAADASGTFHMAGLPPGDWHAAVYLGDLRVCDDFTITGVEPLVVQAGEVRELAFDLPAGALRVRVVDAASSAPVVGAQVTTRPEGESAAAGRFPGFRFRPGWAAVTDAKGEVLLRCLPEGEVHRLAVRASGYAAHEQRGLVPSAAAPETVVQLPRKQ